MKTSWCWCRKTHNQLFYCYNKEEKTIMQSLQSILAQTRGRIHETVIQTAPAFCFLHFVKAIRDRLMLRLPLFWFPEDIFLCRACFVLQPDNQTSQSDKQDHTLRSDLCAALNATESRRCRAFTDFFLPLLFAQQISPFACSASDKAHCWMVSLSDILFFNFFLFIYFFFAVCAQVKVLIPTVRRGAGRSHSPIPPALHQESMSFSIVLLCRGWWFIFFP